MYVPNAHWRGNSSPNPLPVLTTNGKDSDDTLNIGRLSLAEREKVLSEAYLLEKDKALEVRGLPPLGLPFVTHLLPLTDL